MYTSTQHAVTKYAAVAWCRRVRLYRIALVYPCVHLAQPGQQERSGTLSGR